MWDRIDKDLLLPIPSEKRIKASSSSEWPDFNMMNMSKESRRRRGDETWRNIMTRGSGHLIGRIVLWMELKSRFLLYIKDDKDLGVCISNTKFNIGSTVLATIKNVDSIESHSEVNTLLITTKQVAICESIECYEDSIESHPQVFLWEKSPSFTCLESAVMEKNPLKRVLLQVIKTSMVEVNKLQTMQILLEDSKGLFATMNFTSERFYFQAFEDGTWICITGLIVAKFGETFCIYLNPNSLLETNIRVLDEMHQVPHIAEEIKEEENIVIETTQQRIISILDIFERAEVMPNGCEDLVQFKGWITRIGNSNGNIILAICPKCLKKRLVQKGEWTCKCDQCGFTDGKLSVWKISYHFNISISDQTSTFKNLFIPDSAALILFKKSAEEYYNLTEEEAYSIYQSTMFSNIFVTLQLKKSSESASVKSLVVSIELI